MQTPFHDPTHLEADFDWLAELIALRIAGLGGLVQGALPPLLPHPGLASPYSRFAQEHAAEPALRITLLLALAPVLQPRCLAPLLALRQQNPALAAEIGGQLGSGQTSFLPTGETALFLIAGRDLGARIAALDLFSDVDGLLGSPHIDLRGTAPGEPWTQGLLCPSRDLLSLVGSGKELLHQYGEAFPARRISTPLDWADLVLDDSTKRQLEEIMTWQAHSATIMEDWGMRRHFKPGYRALFYGPPGTGKTLTAALLGKRMDKPVFRIDLSLIVSKYIGETEKNLERLFSAAEDKDWILFFDEADALFGKRSRVKDAHDRYANQEVSYLLQRIEDFRGLVILASNNHDNIDEAFSRRFQATIHFPVPQAAERLRLWQGLFQPSVPLDPELNLARIAERYDLSGGAMLNVVRHCSILAVRRDPPLITAQDFAAGIRREFEKQGRVK